MARTALTVQKVTRDGLTESFTPAIADGHLFNNTGREVIRIKNSNAASATVTVPIPALVDGQSVTSRTVNVPATNGDVLIGPFPGTYNQDGSVVWVDYSDPTGVSVSVVEVSPAN